MPLHKAPTSGALSGEAVLAGATATAAVACLLFEALPSTSREVFMCRGLLARQENSLYQSLLLLPLAAAASISAIALLHGSS